MNEAGQWVALVVDDREEALEWLADFPAELGHEVLRASSVNEAMEIFDAHEVDYVLQDLEIPTKPGFRARIDHGYQLIDEIRARAGSEDLYICVVTAEGVGANESTRAWRGGINHYIAKPASSATVLEAIKEAVELAETARERILESSKGKRTTSRGLRINSWGECRVTLGVEVRASSALGGAGRKLIFPGFSDTDARAVLEALYRAGKRGDDFVALFPGDAGKRYKAASAIRKALRAVFKIKGEGRPGKGATKSFNPLPKQGGRYVPKFLIRDQDGNLEPTEQPKLASASKSPCSSCEDPVDPFRCEDCGTEVISTHCRACHREVVHDELSGGPE